MSGPYGNCHMWPVGPVDLLFWEFVQFMYKIWAHTASFCVVTLTNNSAVCEYLDIYTLSTSFALKFEMKQQL